MPGRISTLLTNVTVSVSEKVIRPRFGPPKKPPPPPPPPKPRLPPPPSGGGPPTSGGGPPVAPSGRPPGGKPNCCRICWSTAGDGLFDFSGFEKSKPIRSVFVS